MKHTLVFSLGIALLGASMGMETAHAQRAPISRSDRRQQRQQSMQNMTPEQRSQFFQNQWQQRLNAATPEQRARMEAARNNRQNNGIGTGTGTNQNGAGGQGTRGTNGRNRNGGAQNAQITPAQREANMRAIMTAAGFTDKKQQDPIVAFVFAQEKAREPLLKSAREVAALLNDSKTKPEQLSAKWKAYNTLLEDDKKRHDKDLADLDAKIGWSKDMRLESFLTLVCVITPDSAMIGGAPSIFGTPSPVRPISTTNPPAPNGNTATRNN